jgi:hypothetical protein
LLARPAFLEYTYIGPRFKSQPGSLEKKEKLDMKTWGQDKIERIGVIISIPSMKKIQFRIRIRIDFRIQLGLWIGSRKAKESTKNDKNKTFYGLKSLMSPYRVGGFPWGLEIL